MKPFSEVFPSCLPAGSSDPAVKALRVKREENRLTVELAGTEPVPGWAEDAGRRIREAMGLADVRVLFTGARPDAVAERGRKAAAPRRSEPDGRRGPRVLFGKPPRMEVMSIDTLPREKAKACARGRVFAVGETRERRMRLQNRWRDAVMTEFYITDGTGSVCVRCVFEKGKVPPGLEKRIGEICEGRGHVTVFGEMESYTVMEKEEWALAAACVESAEAPPREDTAPEKRVELHLHTQMSEKDAVTPVAEAIALAARWRHPAVAVTDHGVCHAFPEAMAAGKKYGVKVLYGCEGYLTVPGGGAPKVPSGPEDGGERAKTQLDRMYHIILIARTQDGLRNLYRLVSLAHLEHFKRRPCLTRELLEQWREGIVIGAACERGEVFSAVREGLPWEDALQTASFYDFLEIQPLCNNRFLVRNGHARDDEHLREWNRSVVRLGRELNKPVCATGDVHFLDPEDEIHRNILLANKNMLDPYPLPLYFKTTDEMLEEFSYLGAETAYEVVVTAPRAVADSVGDISPVRGGEYFPVLKGSAEELRGLAYERARALYGDELPPLIGERLEKELSSIIGKGYDIIYTISQKLVRRSMKKGYLVGSRGSVGSSVAAYFAGITEVNALPPHYRCPECRYSEFPGTVREDDSSPPQSGADGHAAYAGCGIDLPDKNCPVCGANLEKDGFDIPFATFLGFDADKKPDIDLNFSSDYHEHAGAHLTKLFGADKVFRAGTITTIGGKNALGYTLKYLEAAGLDVSDAELRRLAKGCEGVKTTTGQHPGGMIIVPQDLEIYDFCPVHFAANKRGGTVCTHFDYHAIEENLLKLDILGHDCPTFIRRMEELTKEDSLSHPLDDPVTMSLFSSTSALGFENDDLIGPVGTVGIPEYGTRFVRGMLQKTKPSTFDELVRIAGLSHGTDVWRGNAEKLIDDGKATLREVICARDDITLYLISRGISAKQSLSISESVRRGKGLQAEWEAAMRSAGVPDWYIGSCRAIKYLFPKAHAAAYAMMSARIAWYKAHRPEAFYAVYFTLKIDDFSYDVCRGGADAIKSAVRRTEQDKDASKTEQDKAVVLEAAYEMLRRGITFKPPDVHTSPGMRFTPAGPGLVAVPLMALAGLGREAVKNIARQRAKGPFLAEDNLASRCGAVTKAHIETLRAAGAFGGLPETAQTTLFG
ncbi:MAG: PolC-type DNA polymerase III [Oscillospiraceae bacterium]|nr:PolC-type DNA polymerase III [Oscillospiraceae bacterium]